jgi:hypothetical protein
LTYFGLVLFSSISGIPLAVLAIMFTNRKRLRRPEVVMAYNLLYEAYRRELWWFELADLVQKVSALVHAACVLLFSSDVTNLMVCSLVWCQLWLTSLLQFFAPSAQCSVGMVVCGIFLMVVLLASPFIRRIDDRLCQLVQIHLFLILLMGAVLETVSFEAGSKEDIFGSVVLILVLCVLIIVSIYHGAIFARRW